jgi:Flp pilus assembly protein TadD
MKHWSSIALLLAGTTLTALCQPAAVPVKVWQGTLTLPSYEEGPPDPNPPFDIYQANNFNYPYTLRTNLTGVKSDLRWRAIFLENQYLKCTVLPDIGGHLYTCIDKISGQPMFYANPSIKKAEIGYRGAWAAFGVEFNFPVSHNWVSMSPVDFAYAPHEDGSASIWVGNVDRVYGMQWKVELLLRPGSTLLEERVTLYNRSDIRHRYYWWNNAGVQVWDDSRVDYPMQFVASHGFTDVHRWPVDADGKDLSLIKNHTDGPVSFFVHGSHEPFMGIWNPHTETGIAHFAEYQDLPAKKIWSWGVDPAGLNWRTALSDNHSAYVEVQAGLFRNQETYAFLEPGQTIRFSEYWMPVRGTGGISRANRDGVVHFDAHGSDVSVRLNVNERLQGTQISITQNGTTLWTGSADMAPEQTWSHSVAPRPGVGKVTFELKDSAGRSLLKQTDGEYDWDPESTIKIGHQETTRLPEPGNRTEDDWLQIGRGEELNGKAVLAFTTYQTALKKYPQSQSLAVAAGRLAASLLRYEEAERLLGMAQQHDTPNSEIAYYLGIAEDGLGHAREAETSYGIAYRQANLRGPAAIKLGELQARKGDLKGAESYLNAALAAEPDNLRAQEELEAVLRALGERSEADRWANLGLNLNPLSSLLKHDSGRPDLEYLAADPYRVLFIAAEYMRLGLYQKALDVLDRSYSPAAANQSEPGTVLPQKHPLVLYYAAYCKQQLGADAPKNWQAASELSTNLVFPWSATDEVVLKAALVANGKDATAQYLLGTLLFSKGMSDEGMGHWALAMQLAPHMQVLDADMGDALLRVKADPRGALAAFHNGLQNDPGNADVYVGLDEAMSVAGASAEERATALSQYPSANAPDSKMPANLVYQLALTRAEAGQYEQALALFKDRFLPSKEGGETSEEVVFEIKLMQAEKWAKASNCTDVEVLLTGQGPGMSLDARSARDYVKLAALEGSCRHAEKAESFLHKAAADTNPADLVWAIRAEKLLGTYDAAMADQQATHALAEAEKSLAASTHSGSWQYAAGMLQAALGRTELARGSFKQALILADDHMSHHLAREALSELSAGKERSTSETP